MFIVILINFQGDNPFILWTIGINLFTAAVYWAGAIFYLILDLIDKPKWIAKYKIQPGVNEPVDVNAVIKVTLNFYKFFFCVKFKIFLNESSDTCDIYVNFCNNFVYFSHDFCKYRPQKLCCSTSLLLDWQFPSWPIRLSWDVVLPIQFVTFRHLINFVWTLLFH